MTTDKGAYAAFLASPVGQRYAIPDDAETFTVTVTRSADTPHGEWWASVGGLDGPCIGHGYSGETPQQALAALAVLWAATPTPRRPTMAEELRRVEEAQRQYNEDMRKIVASITDTNGGSVIHPRMPTESITPSDHVWGEDDDTPWSRCPECGKPDAPGICACVGYADRPEADFEGMS